MQPGRDHATGPRDPVIIGGLAVLVATDLALGRAYSVPSHWGAAVGVVVILTVVGRTGALVGTSVSATASLALSALSAGWLGSAVRTWPSLAEVAGLLLLCCLSVRRLPSATAVAAGLAVGVALAASVVARTGFGVPELLASVEAIGFAAAVGTGLQLRTGDRDRDRQLEVTRHEERLALARELHDVVAHQVAGIVVQAQAAQAVWADRPEVALEALVRIESAGGDALGSMRRLIGTLRSDAEAPLVPAATIEDIRALADRSTAAGTVVHLQVDEAAIPAGVVPSVHRIVGEALTNAVRHAEGATSVAVRIAAVGPELLVTVTDDGSPVAATTPGFGLTGMTERVEALGGRLEFGPRPQGGWSVAARIPIGADR